MIAVLAGVAWALAAAGNGPSLQKVAQFEHQVTGVTVTKNGRAFVDFPRWIGDSAVSVAELKDGKPVPYPDAEWNGW